MNKFLNSSVSIYLTLNLSLSIYKDLDFMFGGVKVAVQEHLQKRVVAFWNVCPSSGIYRPRRKDL